MLLRDLEELRSKRIALENPPIEVAEPVRERSVEMDLPAENGNGEITQSIPEPFIKEEKPDVPDAATTPQDPAKETIVKNADTPKQGPSPPSSDEKSVKPEPSNLTMNTPPATTNVSPAPVSAAIQSSIDSLFDDIESGNDKTTSGLNFDSMGFLNDAATQDNPQTQNNDFDLSTFGNNTQDFNMSDIPTSNGNQTNDNTTTNDAQDDLFAMVNAEGGGEMMDLDGNNAPADESSFEDLFFMGDDTGMGGGTEMEHGEFDDAFFGLN